MKKKKLYVEIFKGLFSFWGIIILILSARWLFLEPYVIPSGSMIPSLLVHDHIIVNKFAYGVRLPFSRSLLWYRKLPKRGDVVVFRSVEDRRFMIKRVIGLPGEELAIDDKRQVWINNQKLPRELLIEPRNSSPFYKVSENSLLGDYNEYYFFREDTPSHSYRVIHKKQPHFPPDSQTYKVPEGHLFVMGDNRDDSRDSRYWGYLPINHLMGQAFGIWLSCEKTLSFLPFLCSPFELRWGRLFRSIK